MIMCWPICWELSETHKSGVRWMVVNIAQSSPREAELGWGIKGTSHEIHFSCGRFAGFVSEGQCTVLCAVLALCIVQCQLCLLNYKLWIVHWALCPSPSLESSALCIMCSSFALCLLNYKMLSCVLKCASLEGAKALFLRRRCIICASGKLKEALRAAKMMLLLMMMLLMLMMLMTSIICASGKVKEA